MITTLDDISLKYHNTFGLDVATRQWIEYTELADLPALMTMVKGQRWMAIGEGSNLLFARDYDGALLHSRILTMSMATRQDGFVELTAGSGLLLDDVVDYTARNGFWGLENLALIPGQIGAAAVQNVGAYGAEIKDVIERVKVYDTVAGEFKTFGVDELGYGYRQSMFKLPENRGRYIVVEVTLRLSTTPAPRLDYGGLRQRIGDSVPTPMLLASTVATIRREKLPPVGEVGSAGSFFKNPVVERSVLSHVEAQSSGVKVPHYELPDGSVKIPAAWLIEQTGWKGKQMGEAAVWHLQPLILVNPEMKAKPSEALALQEAIQKSVFERFGIQLEREAEIVD